MSARILTKKDAPKDINNQEKYLGDNDFIVSKTDKSGIIVYCNEIFSKMAGYPPSQLIGANHNLIRHPDMPRIAFKIAWSLIKQNKEFFGYVKNLCADGSFYWVFTYITADTDSKGNILSYTSVRRKPPKSAINTIIPIYKLLTDAELTGGIEASQDLLNKFLDEKNTSYEELVINLQKGAVI